MNKTSVPTSCLRAEPYVMFAAAMCAIAPLAFANPVDKSQYNLFNPTPREHMRELSADRPDATESPITVDAGHVQLEVSFFAYTHDDASSERSDSWALFDTNVKIGVLNDVDVQLGATA